MASTTDRNIARAIIFVLRQKIHLPPHILARRIIRRDFARKHFNRLANEAAGLGFREVLNIARELEALFPRASRSACWPPSGTFLGR